jgi:GxxExxY protein
MNRTTEKMMDKRDPETYAIIGAAQEVHKTLGSGFLEAVYQEALAREFALREIPFRKEVEMPVLYKGEALPTHYRVDFVCFDGVLVELKALRALSGLEESQVINYLKACGLPKGLLINFGGGSLECKRFAGPKASV